MKRNAALHHINISYTKYCALDLSDTPDLEPILVRQNHSNKKSKYLGVKANSKAVKNKWKAIIVLNKKVYHLGVYETEEEAGRIYAKALYKYRSKPKKELYNSIGLDLSNTPELEPILKREVQDDNDDIKQGDKCKSKYMGVSYIGGKDDGNSGSNKNWRAQIYLNKKMYDLGVYKTEEEAGRVYAKALYNTKKDKEVKIPKGLDFNKIPDQPLILKESSSKEGNIDIKYKGIDKTSNGKYRARICTRYNRRRITLGCFNTQEEAADIYAKADYYYHHIQLQEHQQNNGNNKIQHVDHNNKHQQKKSSNKNLKEG